MNNYAIAIVMVLLIIILIPEQEEKEYEIEVEIVKGYVIYNVINTGDNPMVLDGVKIFIYDEYGDIINIYTIQISNEYDYVLHPGEVYEKAVPVNPKDFLLMNSCMVRLT